MIKNKKGFLIEFMETPLAVGVLLLLIATIGFMLDSFDSKIGSNSEIPIEAQNISTNLNTFTTERLPLIPIFFVLGVFIATIVLVWREQDPTSPEFIIAILIYIIYTIFIGVFKLFFDKLSELSIVQSLLVNAPFITLYFDNIFIFQGLWFFILFTIWGVKR